MAVNSMDEPIKRLLFTEEPYFDESFIGYIMRLAELNEIPDLRWILKLAGLDRLYDYKYRFTSDFKVEPEKLSILTGVAERQLINLLYLHERGQKRNITGNILVLNQQIPHNFVKREKPKICPTCLIEQNYCRRVWELSAITACPHHECLLIGCCQNCQRRINWKRPKLNVCECEFDFRQSAITRLKTEELKLTEYLYQGFGLPLPAKAVNLNYPLNSLAIDDLLTLLFFVAAVHAEVPDCTGIGVVKYKSNVEIHAYLCKSVEIFDAWADSYYDFIRMWQKQDKRYFINCKDLYLSKVQLPKKYSEYELFNQMLHKIFFEEQFAFMHEEFAQFLKGLSSEEKLNQSFRFDSFFD